MKKKHTDNTKAGNIDTKKTKAGNVDTTNLFFIVLALKNYSSESKPLSYREIAEIINDFYKMDSATITYSTVRRIMMEFLVEQGNLLKIPDDNSESEYEDEDNNKYYIIDDESKSEYNNKHNLNFNIKSIKVGRTQKFYYSSNFTASELRFIADTLWSAYSFDPEGIQRLLHKVSGLTPRDKDLYNLCHNPENMMGDMTFFEHIEILCELIKEEKYASIIYEKYDNDLNEVDQQPKIFLPIEMLMLDGHYYCRAASEDGISLLRIDKIGFVDEEETEKIPESVQKEIQNTAAKLGKDSVSKYEYRITHNVAKEGRVHKAIELLVRITKDSEIMDGIVDAFGSDLFVKSCDKKSVIEKLGRSPEPLDNDERWVSIQVNNTQEGVVDFVARHCDEVAIISPPAVRKALERKLKEAVNMM